MVAQSQFIEHFSGDSVPRYELSSLCSEFLDGDWIESKDQSDAGYRLVQTGNVGVGEYIDKSGRARFVSEETFKRLNCTEIFSGDILFSRLPEPLGRCCIIPEDFPKAITAVDCTIARLNERCLPEFLVVYTTTSMYSSQVDKCVTGTTRQRISRNNLAKISVPCPSIDEQIAFVKIVRQADKSKFGGLKSQFIEMFGDYHSNPKGWPVTSFEGFARIDANMTTDYTKYADYPHIGVDSIEKETGILSGYRTVKEDNVISGKYVFTPKHIIYSKIRPNLNKVALPDFDGVCSADAYPILPKDGISNRLYLAYLMR